MSKANLSFSSLSVIIPAYNDEITVGRLVKDVDCLVEELLNDYEIICTNDGSTDNTLTVLEELQLTLPRLKVINHGVNRGFGETIRELYMSATRELVFSLPGDYQYAPK